MVITITKPVFSDNAKKVLKHLQENQGKDETFKDIAKAVHLTDKATNCIITSSLVRKGYAVRETHPDGGTKFIRLTEEGIKADPESTVTYTK